MQNRIECKFRLAIVLYTVPRIHCFGGPKIGDKGDQNSASKPLHATLMQRGDIVTADGHIYKPEPCEMTSGKDINLVVDDFKQGIFKDPKYGNGPLLYNLYIPANYDPSRKYPLVLFMHDAGVVGNNPTRTLKQGLGAIVWATPAEQAKHPCFVLAPQYTTVIADDSS